MRSHNDKRETTHIRKSSENNFERLHGSGRMMIVGYEEKTEKIIRSLLR